MLSPGSTHRMAGNSSIVVEVYLYNLSVVTGFNPSSVRIE